jgi:hypothetical protein
MHILHRYLYMNMFVYIDNNTQINIPIVREPQTSFSISSHVNKINADSGIIDAKPDNHI